MHQERESNIDDLNDVDDIIEEREEFQRRESSIGDLNGADDVIEEWEKFQSSILSDSTKKIKTGQISSTSTTFSNLENSANANTFLLNLQKKIYSYDQASVKFQKLARNLGWECSRDERCDVNKHLSNDYDENDSDKENVNSIQQITEY